MVIAVPGPVAVTSGAVAIRWPVAVTPMSVGRPSVAVGMSWSVVTVASITSISVTSEVTSIASGATITVSAGTIVADAMTISASISGPVPVVVVVAVASITIVVSVSISVVAVAVIAVPVVTIAAVSITAIAIIIPIAFIVEASLSGPHKECEGKNELDHPGGGSEGSTLPMYS